jgi:hypothetical protein
VEIVLHAEGDDDSTGPRTQRLRVGEEGSVSVQVRGGREVEGASAGEDLELLGEPLLGLDAPAPGEGIAHDEDVVGACGRHVVGVAQSV